jgi:FkbM family methyltransferase
MNLFQRWAEAFDKLLFCWRITADTASFCRLIWNTKRFAWHRRQATTNHQIDPGVTYACRWNGVEFPLTLRSFSGDLEVFYEIFWKQIYALPKLSRQPTVLDLGGHIGLFSLYVWLQYPNVHVYTLEPLGRNFQLATRNLSVMPQSQCHLFQQAVWDVSGRQNLWEAPMDYNTCLQESLPFGVEYNSTHTVSNTVGAAHQVGSTDKVSTDLQVDAISLADAWRSWNLAQVDLVKMDVEDAEKRIMRQADWLNRVDHILIELHSKESATAASEAFSAHLFRVQYLSDHLWLATATPKS